MTEQFELSAALSRLGIEELTSMQKSASDAFSKGKDIVLLSPTGTGKTLAYLLPLMQAIDFASKRVQAIVMVPSRELAQQIDGVVKSMKSPLRSVCCYGGRPAMEEHRMIAGVLPHIVIATPGRLVDHLNKRNIEVDGIRTLVIDEFDKCLEFGFHGEMREAMEMMPLVRQRFLLSATDAEQIPSFVNMGRDKGEKAVRIDYLSGSDEVARRINLHVVKSPVKDKLDTLYCLLRTQGPRQSIVFLNYREAVERVYNYLCSEGMYCEMFHGGMEQQHREKALYKFANGTSNVLVSTDLSARGLDIPDIDNIIHYHLPLNEEAFLHRNGRTARWEAEGNSYIILHEEESIPEYVKDEPDEFFIPKKLPEMQLPLWATIYIGKGKKDKISKMDILGFLCKIGGLESKEVGRIDVRDHYAFAAVSRKKLYEVLRKVKGQKIKGVKTIFIEAK
ncbi:MAG: DEAD/DEAH box helicase [Roseburia sp.]|nr:DEAD/DEAH box helicase [Roseburia sp.]MCM1420063.1 DEAD/DEAH box helicase [Bacteroides sp.]